MKKLTVENLNEFISSVSTAEPSRGIKLPRTMTYQTQEYIDPNLIIDKRDEFKDLFRQNLIAFSKRKRDLPVDYVYCTGEKTQNGGFKRWTSNSDDVERFLAMGMLTKLIIDNRFLTVTVNGEAVEKLHISVSDEEIQPVVVREDPKTMTKAKEPDAK